MSTMTWRVMALAAATLASLSVGAAVASPASAPGGLERAPGFIRVDMKPVANPADLSPAERVQVYGHPYAGRRMTPTQVTTVHHRIIPTPVHEVIAKPFSHTDVVAAPKLVPVATAAEPAPAAAPAPAQAAPAAPAAPTVSAPKFDLSKLHAPSVHLPRLNLGGADLTAANARQKLATLPIPEWLTVPGHKTLAVPGLGVVQSKFVSAAGILVLVVILLLLALSSSGGARRRRARRSRNYQPGPMMGSEPSAPAPAPAPVAAPAEAPHGDDHGHH